MSRLRFSPLDMTTTNFRFHSSIIGVQFAQEINRRKAALERQLSFQRSTKKRALTNRMQLIVQHQLKRRIVYFSIGCQRYVCKPLHSDRTGMYRQLFL